MDERKHKLESGLNDVGWGLLFLAFAAIALPRGTTEYAAVAAVGAAIIILNAVRLALGIPISWFSTIIGTTGVVAGALALGGIQVDAFVVFCVLAGAATIAVATIRMWRPAAAV